MESNVVKILYSKKRAICCGIFVDTYLNNIQPASTRKSETVKLAIKGLRQSLQYGCIADCVVPKILMQYVRLAISLNRGQK